MASLLNKTALSNSVQPTASVSNRRSSSSVSNNNDWSTETLIEALKQLPVRLERLEQENRDLRQQLQSLRESEKTHSDDKGQLLAEVRRLKQRHAAMAERKVNMDQRRTENTLSTNRQSDLEKEYRIEFKDGRRIDAIEMIEGKLKKIRRKQELSSEDLLMANRLACFVFEISYECALKARETFLSFYSSVLDNLVTNAPTIGSSDNKKKTIPEFKLSNASPLYTQDSFIEAMVLVKEAAGRKDLNLEKLVKVVKKQLKAKWREPENKEILPIYDKGLKRDLQHYIEYCTKFAWRTVTQVPPLMIDYNTWTYNPVYHNESQAFPSSSNWVTPACWERTRAQKQVRCYMYLWPTLYDCDNRVVEKGEVVLTGQGSTYV